MYVLGIDQRDDAVENEATSTHVVAEKGLHQRRWISESRRLNKHVIKLLLIEQSEEMVQDPL
jgi:hypothetical protein